MTDVGAVLPGEAAAAPAWSDEEASRPTQDLPLAQLVQITLYWLGISALQGGIGIAVQKRPPGPSPSRAC